MSSQSSVSDEVLDLRSALRYLEKIPGQLIATDRAVDAHAELAGVYKRIGAGGTVERPTRLGPAMIFRNVKGYDIPVLVGLMASRERVAMLLGSTPDKLAFRMSEAVSNPVQPVTVPAERAACQEVVYRASDPAFDIRRLLPAPTNTEADAGPYFNLGLVMGTDPENGHADVTIHRLCVQGPDEISIYFVPGRHIDSFRMKAEAAGKPLPVTVNMGLDPAIHMAACFEAPTTPLGFDELTIAGGLRGKPVELVDALTVGQKAIARAEIVIEGEILPHYRVREDQNTGTGLAMPEFPGYTGIAQEAVPVIKVTAVTTRRNPILQTLVGPGEEHTVLAGIPTEASIMRMVEAAMPGRLVNVHAHTAGGGKYLAILQFKKSVRSDEGRQRQAALLAFSAFSELKHVIIVDEDVDPFDSNDVLWAMTTRYQGDVSTVFIPGVRCHPLDPSQTPEFSPSIHDVGISCKTIFDCTVPFHLKEQFKRAQFCEVDPRPFAPQLFE
ncbi:MAG TPA: UbiD family decarboxylase [Geobacteraceae bacterium]